MDELSPELKAMVEKGYQRIGRDTMPQGRNEQFEQFRVLARKWRNLLGEARFDIPTCLYPYVDWEMPKEWESYRRRPSTIRRHEFVIRIPGFTPIAVIYKQFANSADWYFDKFEILAVCSTEQRVHSSRYNDLPLFLALARELSRPKKQNVKVEEIEGGLTDNANLIKFADLKKKDAIPNTKETGYVLTEADFLNNPGCDNPYSDMPIYA